MCLVLCATSFAFVIFLVDLKVFSYILCLIILICVELKFNIGVCVVLLDLGFVALIFCRVLRELKNIVVVARWLCVVTGGDWMPIIITYESILKNT